jgi:hypothetical protein
LIERGNLDRMVVYKTTGADANSLRGEIGESMTPELATLSGAALVELLTETIATDRFPLSPRLSPERSAVEFGIGVGEYDGTVSVSRRVFQNLLGDGPTPQRCIEAYYVDRTRLELIAERKVRRRKLTQDGNVEITGRDLHGTRFPTEGASHHLPGGTHDAGGSTGDFLGA